MASGTMRRLMGERVQLAYFITFSCYGTRLHGDERGSVDGRHNAYGEAPLRPNRLRQSFERRRLIDPPYVLDAGRRWSRGASRRYLWTASSLDVAIHYVIHEQGDPMSIYLADTD